MSSTIDVMLGVSVEEILPGDMFAWNNKQTLVIDVRKHHIEGWVKVSALQRDKLKNILIGDYGKMWVYRIVETA